METLQIELEGSSLDIPLIRTKRRSVCIVSDPYKGVYIRAPLRLSFSSIKDFVVSKSSWIREKIVEAKELAAIYPKKKPLFPEKWQKEKALELFADRTKIYADKLGIVPKKLSLTNAGTKWGSCNSRGGIRINWRLFTAPVDIIDYVIAHELCHIKERNHSKDFWALVAAVVPDYKEKRKRLRKEGHLFGM